jgi:hypothetical protein
MIAATARIVTVGIRKAVLATNAWMVVCMKRKGVMSGMKVRVTIMTENNVHVPEAYSDHYLEQQTRLGWAMILHGLASLDPDSLETAYVEKVEVVSHHGEETLLRTYTKSSKMTAVLNYLRWLRPVYGADCDPEQIPGDDYTITVTLSDGKQEVYQQKTNGYLRENGQRWKNIDPEKGMMLYEIISQMEGDS